MKIVIIQEAGRHEKNKNYRESLCLQRGLSKIPGVEALVWGLGYENFKTPFSEIENWSDVIFVLENYTPQWLPVNEIRNSKKLKIYWSIDSHVMLHEHQKICQAMNFNVLLNSTERYLDFFKDLTPNRFWFPNSYPDELIKPLGSEKTCDIGFCGNQQNRGPYINFLEKYNIKKDIFVIGDDMVSSINSYKIHFNRNISDDINYRTFETLGCGTFLLTNHTPGLEKLFDIGEDLVTYDSFEDLDRKVKFYLENEDERKRIENNGLNKVRLNHTYYERCKTLVEIINSL